MLAEARPEPSEEVTTDTDEDEVDVDASLETILDPDTATEKQLFALCTALLDEATRLYPDPAIHGTMLHGIINNMLNWHKAVSKKMMSDGEEKSADCWMRDAGKFQAIANILDTISFGENDPFNHGEI